MNNYSQSIKNRQLAMQHAERGWYVFPCKPDKSPYTPHGKDDATLDPEKIGEWWQRWPGALIGVYCEKSGFFALDIDNKNGKNGSLTWVKLVQTCGGGQDVSPGPVQRTTNNGLHALFRYPDGLKIPNNSDKLGEGLDLRSDGYICTGPGYTWMPGHGPDAPLTDAPAWLLDLIRNQNKPKEPERQAAPAVASNGNAGGYWLRYYLDRARVGNRNQAGFDLACQLRDSGLTEGEAERYILDYARSVPQAPDNLYTERAALASLQSAYRGERREDNYHPGLRLSQQHSTPPMPEPPEDDSLRSGRFVTFDALEALDFDEPIDWLVEGLVGFGDVVTVAGAGGTGKTYAMVDLAVAIAVQNNWLDFPVRKTKVLIIDEESGRKRLMRRLGRVIRGHFAEDLIKKGDITCISLPILNLRDPAEAILLTAKIQELGAGLVVIDALIDIAGGADENKSQEMHQIFQRLRKIADDTGATIIVIHHTNKAGDVRGSTAIKGACDLILLVEKKESSPNMDFETVKARDIEPLKFAAVMNFSEGMTWMTGSATRQREQQLTRPQRWVINYLKDHGPSTRNAITGEPETCSTRAASDAIYQLAERKIIYRTNPEIMTGRGIEAIYDLKPEDE